MEQGLVIRTVIFLWLLLSGISGIQAQTPGNIDPLSTWIVENHYSDGYSVYCDDYKYHLNGTITVDPLTYHKVYKTGREVNVSNGSITYYNNNYAGGLREQDGIWYKLTNDSIDVLLFDFNQDVGDTLNSCLALDSVIIISGIDTIMIDGEPKKKFLLQGVGWNTDGFIIEDIGANTGLFEPMIFYEYWSVIHCYAIDDYPLWVNPEIGECDLTVNIPEQPPATQLSTYPNPFTTATTIEFTLNEKYKIQISIYNSIGEIVYQLNDQFEKGHHKVTWSPPHNLPAGLYYAVLRTEEGVSVLKMVKQ